MGERDVVAQRVVAKAQALTAGGVRPGSVVVWRHPALGVRLPAIVVATVESLSGVNLDELAEQNWPAIELGDGVVHLVVFTAANRDPVRGSLLAAPMVGFSAVEVPCFVAASVAFGDGPGEWSWPI